MPPKKAAELVITPEEEEVLNQLLVEQMATLKPGVDYPLKRVANGLGAVIDALNAGKSTDEALEHFLTELDVYAFNMVATPPWSPVTARSRSSTTRKRRR